MNLTSEKSQAFLAKFLQFIAFLLVRTLHALLVY